MKLDLIDEYRLFVSPVVLGGGTTFFADVNRRIDLELVGDAYLRVAGRLPAIRAPVSRVGRDTIALWRFELARIRVGRDDGTLQVRTYREGLAQKVGHDLIIDVGQWEAAAEVREDGTLSAVQLDADPRSLQVREGLRGVKPLTDKDRAAKSARSSTSRPWGTRPVAFRSTAVEPGSGGLTVRGELELAGTKRAASFELEAGADGRVRGTLPLTQSEWGIKPYRAMMGALKVRDTIEVILDVRLPLR